MLECSELVTSLWKCGHPSDTEEYPAVGLSSEDEAAGLEPEPGVARHRFGGPVSVGAPAPVEVPPEVCPAGDGSNGEEEGAEIGQTAGVHPSLWGRPS